MKDTKLYTVYQFRPSPWLAKIYDADQRAKGKTKLESILHKFLVSA